MKLKKLLQTIIILIVLASAYYIFYGEETFSNELQVENGIMEVAFCPYSDCETFFIQKLSTSEDIKCAFYDLNLENLTNTLNLKGAEVLVFEDNYENFGKEVFSAGLMHNKFCILDEKAVITGSMNPTNNGAYKNNNNLIYIESKILANNYLKEFEELNLDLPDYKTKTTKFTFNNATVENYFCPEDNCKEEVLSELRLAQEEIVFMTFSFTDVDIANILIQKNKTMKVTGLLEKNRINQQYNVHKYLNKTDMKVFLDNNSNTMHHKVFIIDGKTVITGSYNPTKSATTKNDENILIFHNEKVAEVFLNEFNRLTQ